MYAAFIGAFSGAAPASASKCEAVVWSGAVEPTRRFVSTTMKIQNTKKSKRSRVSRRAAGATVPPKAKFLGTVRLPEIAANAKVQQSPSVPAALGNGVRWDARPLYVIEAFPADECHLGHLVVEGQLGFSPTEVSVGLERNCEGLCRKLIDCGFARLTFSRLRLGPNKVELEILVVGGMDAAALREEVVLHLTAWIERFFDATAMSSMGIGKISRAEAKSNLVRMACQHEQDNRAVAENFKFLNPNW